MTPEFTAFVNKTIDAIKKADPEEVAMSTWGAGPGTRMCAGGWMGIVMPDPDRSVADYLAELDPDVSPEQISDLFYIHSGDLGKFDRLPPMVRKELVLEVLANFRDTGVSAWSRILRAKAPGVLSP